MANDDNFGLPPGFILDEGLPALGQVPALDAPSVPDSLVPPVIPASGFVMPDAYIDQIKGIEGFAPRAKWDYKQYSVGYGTRGVEGETITPELADRRLRDEIAKAARIVDKHAPDAPEGVKAALTSLTFNAGDRWVTSGLGDAVRKGDYERAKAQFARYTKAGGQDLPGLVSRRQQELAWFDAPSSRGGSVELTADTGTVDLPPGFTLDQPAAGADTGLPPGFTLDAPKLEPKKDAAKGQTFGQAFGRGVDQMQGMLYGGVEALGEATGSKTLTQFGKEGRTRNEEEAKAYGPAAEFSKIRGVGDFGQWAKEIVGSQIPIMGPMLGGALAGSAVAGPIGGLIGAFVPGFVMSTGEVQSNIKEKDPNAVAPSSAFVGGAAIAALDSILPGKIGSSLVRRFGAEAAEEIAKRALSKPVTQGMLVKGAKGVVTGMATEGVTEALQEAIGDVAAAYGTGKPLDPALGTKMLEAGAAGALMGGIMGPFGGAPVQSAPADDDKATAPPVPPSAAQTPPQPTPASSGQVPPPIPQARPEEATLLQRMGYSPADIAAMTRAEVDAELANAQSAGVTAPQATDAPSAEPIADLAAQIADVKGGSRQGVFLSQENIANVETNPAFVETLGQAIAGIGGADIVENIDGKGGVLVAKDKATADAARAAISVGVSPEAVIGLFTGSGTGKAPGADTVVQQRTPEGAVTRETLVPAVEAPAAAAAMATDGRTVEAMPAVDALARREAQIATEQGATAEVVGNSPELPTTFRPAPAPDGDGSRQAPVKVEIPEDVAAVAKAAAADYTPAQGEANNRKLGHAKWNGLDISIETEAGGVRKGVNKTTGEPWETTMGAAYGYIRGGAKSGDGMALDVFMGTDPASDRVWVIDEITLTGKWRQHKALIAFPNREAAIAAYTGTSSKTPEMIGAVTEMPVEQFRAWAREGAKTKPLAYKPPRKAKPSDPMQETALSFIRNAGGIRPDAELRQIIDRARIPGLLNRNGLSPDDMLRALEEQSFIQDRSGPDRPIETTLDDLYDLVGRIVNGERVGRYGTTVPQPMSRKAEEAVYREQVMREIENEVAALGVRYDFSEVEEDRLFDLVGNQAMDIGDAIERVAIESIENEAAAADDGAGRVEDSPPFGGDEREPGQEAEDGEPGGDAGPVAGEEVVAAEEPAEDVTQAAETGPSGSEDVVVTAAELPADVPTFADAKVAVKTGDPLKVIREYLEGKGWPARWAKLTDEQKRTAFAEISGAKTEPAVEPAAEADTVVEPLKPGEPLPVEKEEAAPAASTPKERGPDKLKDYTGITIDGYVGQEPGSERDGSLKRGFLSDARGYLLKVSKELAARGFAPYTDRKGKPQKPVNVNPAGPAVSGDVSLSLIDKDGNGIYVNIGTALAGPKGGISLMARKSTRENQYSSGQNNWLPVDITVKDLADRLEKIARPAVRGESPPATAATPPATADSPRTEPSGQTSLVPEATTGEKIAAEAKAKGEKGKAASDDAGPLFNPDAGKQTDLVDMAKAPEKTPEQLANDLLSASLDAQFETKKDDTYNGPRNQWVERTGDMDMSQKLDGDGETIGAVMYDRERQKRNRMEAWAALDADGKVIGYGPTMGHAKDIVDGKKPEAAPAPVGEEAEVRAQLPEGFILLAPGEPIPGLPSALSKPRKIWSIISPGFAEVGSGQTPRVAFEDAKNYPELGATLRPAPAPSPETADGIPTVGRLEKLTLAQITAVAEAISLVPGARPTLKDLRSKIVRTIIEAGRDGAKAATIKEISGPDVDRATVAKAAEAAKARQIAKINAAIDGLAPKKTGKAAAKSAAANVGKGLEQAAAGLMVLFDPKGKVGSGPSFDEQTYAKAKPHFEAALAHFAEAGADMATAMRELVKYLAETAGMSRDGIEAMRPYIVRFMVDREGKAETNSTKETSSSSAETPAKADADALVVVLKGAGFKTILEARKFVREAGIVPADATNKQIDETIEAAVVRAAREIVAERKTPSETFNALLRLYNAQPNLASRTGTSVANQAYSTPVPLAYVASRLAGVKSADVVYEPTAGNGALLIEAGPGNDTVYANELDPSRAKTLGAYGFEVTSEDAGKARKIAEQADAIIMNPPFGAVKEGGKSRVFTADGWQTTQIDHAVALNALESLTDGGRAVLILGGTKSEDMAERRKDYRGKAKREFYHRLYSNYRVSDHFTVSGDLYTKQGASWPVDVIVIEGRGKSERELPAASPPAILKTWDEVGAKLDGRPDTVEVGAVERPARAPAPRGAEPASDDAGARAPAQRGGSERVPAQAEGDAGAVRPERDRGEPRDVGGGREPSAAEPRSDRDGGRADRAPAAEPIRPRVKRERQEGASQAPYEPVSNAASLDTLIPVNMADAARKAMERVAQAHGSVDELVADRLGYDAKDLGDYFSAEQLDALGAAIANVEKGAAFIIGDQTGIGKGRIAAGMLRYAMKQGMVPVFVTEKPDLYGDMFRDMRDIGIPEMLDREPRMFITNAGETITLDEEALAWKQEADEARANGEKVPARRGKFLTGGTAARVQDGMSKIAAGEDVADVVFTTYDQMNTVKGQDTPRRRFLSSVAPRAMIVLDESHNAGGTSKSGWESKNAPKTRADFAREIASKAKGVMFSSATYAKRPDVMDLYARTDMGKAVDDAKDLPALIQQGGVPMQQIVASMLAESGQYLRRERSFDGVEYALTPVEVDQKAYKQFSASMQAIFRFDLDVEDFRAKWGEEMLDRMGMAKSRDDGVGSGSASSTGFGALMHNITNQMLLAIKAESAAREAINAVKAGEKPVIALANTNESFIKDFAENEGIKIGEALDLDFAAVLERYLERTLRVTIKHPDGKTKEHRHIPLSDLPGSLRQGYQEALNAIRAGSFASLPISPIDWIRYRLGEAGISIKEVTGRQTMIDYAQPAPKYVARPKQEQGSSGKRASIAAFNRGSLDALILNRSGSTGVSMHASKTFKDQRKRRMILAQAEGNIDTHLQMLGRVHRTGQVLTPSYSQIAADIPAEARPTAVLMKKMASLNANTTGARSSNFTVDSVDFMNEVGDKVVAEHLIEDPDLNEKLGEPLTFDENGIPKVEDVARKATGRLVLLDVEVQAQFLDAIQKAYTKEIEQLDALGENPLEAKTVDIQAKTIETTEIKPRTGDSPFTDAVRIEKVSAKAQGRAMPVSEVVDKVAEALKATKPVGSEQAALEQLERKGREWSGAEIRRIQDVARRQMADELAATKAESRDSVRAKALAALDRWQKTMLVAYPGARVSLGMPAGDLDGIVLSVERTGKAKSITALSAWTVKVAVPDSARQFEFPMSKLFPDGVAKGDGEKGATITSARTFTPMLIKAFEDARKEGRETRFIVTGNILGGYDQTRGRGRIVNFTTEDGQIRPGILMGREFDVGKFMDNRRLRFPTGAAAAEFLAKVSDVEVTATDGDIVVSGYRGAYRIEMAAARAKAGKYFTDADVRRALVGKDFERRGNKMIVEGLSQREVAAAIDEMKKIGAAFETNTAQDVAQEIIGAEGARSVAAPTRKPISRKDHVKGRMLLRQPVDMTKDAERIFALMAGSPSMLPANVPEIVPIAFLPKKGSPKEYTVVAMDKFGREYRYDDEADLILKTQGMYLLVAGQPVVSLSSLDLGGDIVQSVVGARAHEAVHALRVLGYLPGSGTDRGSIWGRLVGHAGSLGVLSMSRKELYTRMNDPRVETASDEVTTLEVYTELYGNRPYVREILDQEAVAHMVEVYKLGGWTAQEIEPIRDILDRLDAGEIARSERTALTVDMLRAIGGSVAATADREALSRAMEMDATAPDREADPDAYEAHRTRIWDETGWYKGVDGQWRFEIPDRPFIVREGVGYDRILHANIAEAYVDAGLDEIAAGVAADDTGARGRTILNDTNKDGEDIGPQIIVIGPRDTWKVTALHELQHLIQEQEGFAVGGNAKSATMYVEGVPQLQEAVDAARAHLKASKRRMFRRIPLTPQWRAVRKAREDVYAADKALNEALDRVGATSPEQRYALYQRLAGEVEARMVERRLGMTAKERRARPPWLDYDVPESDQIVVLRLAGDRESAGRSAETDSASPMASAVPASGERMAPDAAQAIKDAVEIVARIAGRDVDVRTEARLPEMRIDGQTARPGGLYQKQGLEAKAVITLAYADPRFDVRTVAGHEAYHHVESELASPAEMALLRSPAEMERATRHAAAEIGRNIEETRKLPDYEIRAIAFQRYRRMREEGMTMTPLHIGIRRLWDAMVRLVQGVKNALQGKGFDSMEAVFERARTGEMVTRAAERRIDSTAVPAPRRGRLDRQMVPAGYVASEPFDLAKVREVRRYVSDVPLADVRTVQPSVGVASTKAKLRNPGSDGPVSLFKWDGLYYVNDGNHRIEAARATRAATIRAEVIELAPRGTDADVLADRRPADAPAQRVGAQEADQGPGAEALARRANATLIERIGKDDPHPGRVLAFHGSDATFDRFDLAHMRSFGVHFGGADLAELYVNPSKKVTTSRIIPAVLDLPNVLTLPDMDRWNAVSIAKAVEVAFPFASDLGAEIAVIRKDAGEAAATEALRQRLTSIGVHGIRYWNDGVLPGWAYIVWEKGRVTSPTSGETLLSSIPRRGQASETIRAIARRVANDDRAAAQASDISAFADQWLAKEDGTTTQAISLYEAYVLWADQAGADAVTLQTFNQMLGDLGYERAHVAGRTRWMGVAIKAEGERPAATLGEAPANPIADANAAEVAAELEKGVSIGEAFRRVGQRLMQMLGLAPERAAETESRIAHLEAMQTAVANDNVATAAIHNNVVALPSQMASSFGVPVVVDFSRDERFHHLFYRDPSPDEVKEFQKWLKANPDQLIRLYHGSAAVNPIEQQGILKTSASRRNSLQSASGVVSLSVYPGHAEDFARFAAANRGADAQGRKTAVYTVELRVAELIPDKDQLRNQRHFAQRSVGNSLAESLVFGRGAWFKGNIPPNRVQRHDPQLPDIMASIFPTATSTGTFFGRRVAAIMRRMAPRSDQWRVRIQDKFLMMRRQQEAIERQTGASLPLPLDVYVAESLYHGRAGERMADLQQKRIEPLVEHLRKNEIDADALGEYLYARHASERNAYIRTIDPGNDAGSGMTDAESQQILARISSGPKAQAFADAAAMVDRINAETRDTLLAAGLISRETYDAWSTDYQHYVPLRGFEANEEEAVFPRVGKGFNVRGSEAFRALGRRSKSDNPVAYVLLQAQQAIVRAEKNRVNKTLLRLVETHPDPDVWQVYRGETKRVLKTDPATGKEYVDTVFVPPQFSAHDPSIVGVKVGGKQHYIQVHNPNLARALRGVGSSEFDHAIVRNMMALTRFYAQLLTSWNPEFVVGNFFRDVQTALINSKDVQDLPAGARKKMLAEALSLKSIRGIYNALRGDGSSEHARYFDEYRRAGGKISFMEFNDVERIKARINGLLTEGNTRRAIRNVAKYVEDLNSSVENGVRLSTYIAMRKAGIAQDRAAFVARELTVNFNRKGEWGSIINAAYLFFNASVQGSTRMLQAIGRSKAVRRAVYAIAFGGFAMEMINYLVAGDDDDKENAYDKIKPWVKERNMIVMLPGRKDYLMIPMPYGYNVPYVAGQKIGEMVRSAWGHGKTTPAKAAAGIMSALMDSFNPLGTSPTVSFLQMASPTILDPVVQVAENKTWYGGPIYPTKFDRNKPDSETYFASVHPAFIEAAKWANRGTGGNAAKSGMVDVSPEVLEHYATFLGGGIAKFVLNATGTGQRALSGEEFVPEKTPILRRLYGAQTSTSRRSDFYEAWTKVDGAHYEVLQLNKAGDKEGAQQARAENKAEIEAYGIMKGTQRALSQYSKQRAQIQLNREMPDAEKKAKLDEIKAKENEIILRALDVYNKSQKVAR